MIPDRWEGTVHHYDYDPDNLERYQGRDAVKVAEAYLYAQSETSVALGIVVMASAQDLRSPRVTPEKAIREGRALIRKLLDPKVDGGFAESAKTLKESETYLFTWDERSLGRVFPPPAAR
jgi:hypothetical protein